MDRQPDRRRLALPGRAGLVTAGGSLAGLLGHLAGGGTTPDTCSTILTVLLIGAAATLGAVEIARRARGSGAAWGVLLAGQVAMEVTLRTPAADAAVRPSTALVHVLAAAGLAALLLGSERVAGDLRDLLDRWVPRSWAGFTAAEVVAALPCTGIVSAPLGAHEHRPQAPRGPPHS